MTSGAVDRFPVRRNPLRMVCSAAPWVATAYLLSYVVVGSALFAVSFTALAVTGALALFTLGVPLLAGSALVVRGCAEVERLRSRLVTAPIGATYREMTESGALAHVRARWSDPVTWRDTMYLVLLYLPLMALDTAALAIWLTLLAGITLPLWYWAVPSTGGTGGLEIDFVHNSPHGMGVFGIWVGSLPAALLVTVVCAILALPAAYLVVAAARLHRWVAGQLLGPYTDPLAEAKRVLVTPGPLGT